MSINNRYASEKWLVFSQASLWILSILTTFLLDPPMLSLTDETSTKWLVRFLVAVIAALLFIPQVKFSRHEDYKSWFISAIITLVLGLIVLASYNYLKNNWSIDFYGNKLSIGEQMFPEAMLSKKMVAKEMGLPFIDIATFVKTRQGKTELIWPIAEITQHFYVMTILYILSICTLSLFLNSILQAIYCHDQPDQRSV